MFFYVVAGLEVASDLALAGLIALDRPQGAPEVLIEAGDVPVALDRASAVGPNWSIAGDRFLIEVPGIVTMLLSGGRRICYRLAEGVTAEDAAVFVSGTGFGILLHQRRRVVFHASAVRVGGGAVLFCGPSGAGKSTLAAALAERGYPLLSDDFCALLEAGDGPPLVPPDGRQLKLWQNAIDRLALEERRTAPVRTKLRKFHVRPAAATGPAPLAALYVLREARLPGEAGIVRPNLVDAAVAVRANAYRPGLVRRMAQAELYFEAAAHLVRNAGVFTLTRPLSFADLPRLLASLEEHWRTIGLVERAA